jgi:hypothetical protein
MGVNVIGRIRQRFCRLTANRAFAFLKAVFHAWTNQQRAEPRSPASIMLEANLIHGIIARDLSPVWADLTSDQTKATQAP